MVSFSDFLNPETFDGFENKEKYERDWLPKVEKYRADLQKSIKPEFSIKLPKPIDQLVDEQFNAVEYLHNNKLLTEKEFEITDTPVSKLVEKISLGTWSAVDVFKAYAKRATIAHQLTNCALELFIDEGLERAQFLDDFLEKNGKTIGPLHGVPVSLKEHLNYKGRTTHGGYVSLIDNKPEESACSIRILENLGAVFYVRTNEPQALCHLCGNNNFIGWSRCPYNLSLTSGGSSSGEGSITAFGGSAIGIGTDVGGSIRVPAAFSGSFGMRLTTNRFSKAGCVPEGGGFESVPVVQGPLARSVEDLDYLMDAYANHGHPWEIDCMVMPFAWRKVDMPQPEALTVAIEYDDGIITPTPPITRALKTVANKLKAAGVKVVEHKPIKTQAAFELVNKLYVADSGDESTRLLSSSGEPLCKLTKWCSSVDGGSTGVSASSIKQLNLEKDALRQEYTDYMNENGIDMIISPAFNNVAAKPETAYSWAYTSLWNLLDFPTLSFQTGLFQDPGVDKWAPKPKPRNPLEELTLDLYDPKEFKHAPIGLQLSGRRYFDEEVVAAGKTITEILGVNLYEHKETKVAGSI